MRIFLSGPMGAGKSTVGREVASRLGLRFLDLDALIDERHGMGASAYFEAHGEAAYRDSEAALAMELAEEDDVVVALGGGTVVREAVRHGLMARGLLFTLMAPLDVLVSRIESDTRSAAARPLVAGGAEAALRRILDVRRGVYAEAHACIDARGDTSTVVTRVCARAAERPMAVRLGERSYSVDVGRGIRSRATQDALTIADTNTSRYAHEPVVFEAGEAQKHIGTVEMLWDAASERGLDRSGLVVGVGGGVVGDLSGFVAATWMRGLRFGLVATSIVAMVDSSVGGKTGFNREGGKNLVGAFHQPSFVLCDIETLATLPDAEYRAGLAEIVKAAWIAGEADVSALIQDADALAARDDAAVERAVRRAIGLKAQVVEADEREAGQRMLLNLGHTFGHAYEAQAGYGALRHGEAVALGLVTAQRVGAALGVAQDVRLTPLLERLGLPTNDSAWIGVETFAFLQRDKKRVGEGVRFVVPGAPGETRVQRLGFEELQRFVR